MNSNADMVRFLSPVFKQIATHPLNRKQKLSAFGRFFRWQIASRLIKSRIALPFVNDSFLLARNGQAGATGNWYSGLHEVHEMGFLLHTLRSQQLFVDIGANVGSYTILASKVIGANVISVEPIPATFSDLNAGIKLNDVGELVTSHNCGVSGESGELWFTISKDTMNCIVTTQTQETILVPVVTLDELVGCEQPSMIKIDVEGHEWAVIEGGHKVLSSPNLNAVIMETNGLGNRLGVTDTVLVEAMEAFGFIRCQYNALTRELFAGRDATANSIFVRDIAYVQSICSNAPTFQLVTGTI